MDGDDLDAVVKKAKSKGCTVELLEHVLSETDASREPKAYQKLVQMLEEERKLNDELL